MATITTEFGKVVTKKQRAVYLRLRDKKTEKRIATGIRVNESEISPKTKKIKNFEKAQAVEKLRAELLLKMTAMAPEIHYDDSLDASRIASSIVTKRKVESLDFFSFAEEWISKNSLKSTKNYNCTLNALEAFLKRRVLALPSASTAISVHTCSIGFFRLVALCTHDCICVLEYCAKHCPDKHA